MFCKSCNKPISGYGFTGFCLSCKQKGKLNHQWKGGIKHHKDGYIYIKLEPNDPYYSMVGKNNYVFEHRYKMAVKLGRPLKPKEVVHHKDKKDDNRIYKLKLMIKNAHDRIPKSKDL